jgi:hypothetical protein
MKGKGSSRDPLAVGRRLFRPPVPIQEGVEAHQPTTMAPAGWPDSAIWELPVVDSPDLSLGSSLLRPQECTATLGSWPQLTSAVLRWRLAAASKFAGPTVSQTCRRLAAMFTFLEAA